MNNVELTGLPPKAMSGDTKILAFDAGSIGTTTVSAIVPIGAISMYGGRFAPENWAMCDGSPVTITNNEALYSVIGKAFGGGEGYFRLPNFKDCFPMGTAVGETGGSKEVVLSESQLPAHTHTATTTINVGDDLFATLSDVGIGNILGGERRGGDDYQEYIYSSGSVLGQMRADAATTNIGSTGAGQPVSIVPPFLGIGFIIRVR